MIMKYSSRLKGFALAGGYRVRVTFRDDYAGEVDLWPLFANPRGPLTEPFREQTFFQKAFLDEGTLAWPNGYDMDPDVLIWGVDADGNLLAPPEHADPS